MRPPRRPVGLLRRQAGPSSGDPILEQVRAFVKASTPAQLCAFRPTTLLTNFSLRGSPLTDAPQSAGLVALAKRIEAAARVGQAPATSCFVLRSRRARQAAGSSSVRIEE